MEDWINRILTAKYSNDTRTNYFPNKKLIKILRFKKSSSNSRSFPDSSRTKRKVQTWSHIRIELLLRSETFATLKGEGRRNGDWVNSKFLQGTV